MCGRFTSLLSPELMNAIREIFGITPPKQFEPRYNIAPTQQVWVVRSEGDHNRLELMKWGLVPSWAKDPAIGSRMINARSESVRDKPAFRHSIRYRRCIVPVSGFYEWSHAEGKKQPHFIHMADGSPICFAGLWDHWKGPGEENFIETFTILTTAANKLLQPIHDRMPVILRPDDYGLWLNREMHDPEQLTYIYKPLPSNLLTLYRVSDLVNNPRFDSPACIARC
ncbi:MAG: SOS response-associated peptidase [Desulfuromonadales bacterium]|nr:SOS response-associated peptidase [Desulfuromonadales bacterium]